MEPEEVSEVSSETWWAAPAESWDPRGAYELSGTQNQRAKQIGPNIGGQGGPPINPSVLKLRSEKGSGNCGLAL